MWTSSIFLGFAVLLLCKTCQGQNIVAEGYFVVDDSVVQNYVREINTTESYAVKYQKALTNVRKDVDYIITMINSHFSTLNQYSLFVEVRVRRLDILSSNIINSFLPGTRNIVDSIVARNLFQNWLNLQNAFNVIQYDFAMHWTGFDLYGSSGLGETSFTNLGSICSAEAISVAELMSTFRDVRSSSHAIANLLGANADGIASSNLMAVLKVPGDINRWTFSGCTATSIREFVRLANSSCLLTTSASSTKPAVNYATYSGSILDPNVICQRTLNDSRSYMCLNVPQMYNFVQPKGNTVCGQIFCHIPNTQSCTPAYVSDGMVCDNQKRCTSGQCSTYQTPVTDSNCVFGDQKMLEFPSIPFYGTCQAFISTYGASSCYNAPINVTCCSTCKLYNTGRVGCEYGDQSNQCSMYSKASVCPQYKNTLCCGYCNGYVGKREATGVPTPPPVLNVPVLKVEVDIQSYTETANAAH